MPGEPRNRSDPRPTGRRAVALAGTPASDGTAFTSTGKPTSTTPHLLIRASAGTGKTYLACALAHAACRAGYRAVYCYGPRLFRDLTLAHADGSIGKLLKRFAKADLLVLDDWGLAKLDHQGYRDFLEILDDRQGHGSALITSQFPVDSWHGLIADATLADAILDRLVHNSHRIELRGESMRKRKPIDP